MRPTKICEEEIEKILAMSDEDEEDFSISESEFETNLLEEGMNSSEDDSSDNSEDWNEEPPPQALQDNIIPFSKRLLCGKNKYKWATTKGKRRRSAINIVHHARGPTGAAKNVTDCAEVFKLFITDEILSIIAHYTNIEIEKRNGDFPTEKPVNKTELEALIGILILSAVMKNNHLTSLAQMCSAMSCSKKTKRWLMCMFYGILNIAFVNSYVIYVHNALSAKTKPLSRREFMKKLHSDLVKPHMAERLKNPNLHSELQKNIRDILSVPVEEASVKNVPSKKKN